SPQHSVATWPRKDSGQGVGRRASLKHLTAPSWGASFSVSDAESVWRYRRVSCRPRTSERSREALTPRNEEIADRWNFSWRVSGSQRLAREAVDLTRERKSVIFRSLAQK